MPDPLAQFAEEVRRFSRWVRAGTDTGPAAAREALVCVTRLYAAALVLPATRENSPAADPPPVTPSGGDDRTIRAALCSRLPFCLYGEVYDPRPVPPEEPVVGDVADDLVDILADTEEGLRMYEAGQWAEAVWVWGFYLAHHWGEHATSAARALHGYLAREYPGVLHPAA